MSKELYSLFLFIVGCFVVYLGLKIMRGRTQEGMTDASGNTVTPPANGIAGNATSYGASIKSATIKLQDALLISKYRTDYETVILNMDDYVNNAMLQLVLSVDTKNPADTLTQLAQMYQAKAALNDVMNFIDKQ
jgi:hypothetical protein